MLKIAVAGAGWYGCHIAATLLALGLDVQIFERAHRPLNAASGNNQFRLHMGFHYARSHRTRIQSRDGYSRFLERYPRLSAPVPQNIYAVPRGDSLIDFATYKLIMSAAGIEYREVDQQDMAKYRYENLDGVLYCQERVILTSRSREYFLRRLGDNLRLNTPVEEVIENASGIFVNGEQFDFIIDTTWGHLLKPVLPCFWEPTLLLYYEGATDEPALTLVDGQLASIYPTEEPGLFTLSSVPFTPLGHFYDAAHARAALSSVSSEIVVMKRQQMEQQISRYIPDFKDRFRFADIQLAIKTKPVGASDDRSCWVGRYGRQFSVLSGKIDTIFFASQDILARLEAEISARGLELDHDKILHL